MDLNQVVINALEDVKGQDIVSLDVAELSDVMDTLVIVTGTSNRHVKSLANNVVMDAKAAGEQPLGVEGMETGEWVLVDLGGIVVHVMLEQSRRFYDLEKLWSMEPANRQDESDEDDLN
ncbi:ribosome silencing factor [uncultured Pseudoteredinibacter sp.]|uniref:ribosome silencing factor n=1 Tax=uncultured Pseudoteredinibacter sp. TaxID=1641701 RepID=UPI00262ACEAF|nr:ribosome silencing factor [uncultured Pseudoteredinibacter sp.]